MTTLALHRGRLRPPAEMAIAATHTARTVHHRGSGDGPPAPGGDQFDNLAVYIGRLRPDGTTERLWTVDLDAEHCEAFWEKNPATPSKDFS